MSGNIKEILNKVNEGQISCEKAIDLIKNIQSPSNTIRKTSKLKISIISTEKNIRIPGIHFWLINGFLDLGFGLGSIVIKFTNDLDEDVRKLFDSIDRRDIKQLLSELRNYGPFNLVHIQDGRDIIKISIL